MTASAINTMSGELKRRRDLVTPEGLALSLTIATKGSRVGAFLIDLIILTVATIAFAILFDQLGSNAGEGTGGFQEFMSVVLTITIFAMWNGYFLVFEIGPRGATPGKRMSKIRVASRDGGKLTPAAVVARNLLRDIEFFLPIQLLLVQSVMSIIGQESGYSMWLVMFWSLIFLLFPFFNKDNLRAGDLIAGTWVVEDPRSKLDSAISTEGAAAAAGKSVVSGATYSFGDEELSVYGEYEVKVLEKVLREDQASAIEEVHEAICRKIGWNPGAGDERAFLEAFYAQLRAKLEGDMRFGKRKADKFSDSA